MNLNCQASQAAMASSAFTPALDCLRSAIALADNPWTKNHEISITLHTECAACLHCTGNLDESQKHFDVALEHARTTPEKESSHVKLIALLKAKGKLEQALQVGCDSLTKLDELFSLKPSKMKIMNENEISTKRLKDMTDEQLMASLKCPDPSEAAACSVLGMLFGPLVHLQCKDALDTMQMPLI